VGHPAAEIKWPHRLLHEAADEIERMHAFEAAYLKWAMTPGGGQSEGDAFVELVELVESYNDVEASRAGK
jgi:hypothetical protein